MPTETKSTTENAGSQAAPLIHPEVEQAMIGLSPAELRAEADRLESDSAKANRGKVYIYLQTGFVFVHDGRVSSNPHDWIEHREASEAEVKALCAVPEFAAYLHKMRVAP